MPANLLYAKIIVVREGREQRRRRWGAPRAMLLAGTPRAARQTQRNLARCASDVTDDRMARTRRGGRRVRNGPRRAGGGGRRYSGRAPRGGRRPRQEKGVPEVALRGRGVLLVPARSSPLRRGV